MPVALFASACTMVVDALSTSMTTATPPLRELGSINAGNMWT